MRLMEVEGLTRTFRRSHGRCVTAVDGISFQLKEGETLAIVGESGCGKSTTARCVVRLEDATAGRIEFDGRDISTLRGSGLKAFRRDVQFVSQDPYASLDPRMTVGEIVREPLDVHGWGSAADRVPKVRDALELVGLRPEHSDRYPHELSGGQRQRVAIARALVLAPRLIVLDEPVSALDVSIQAQIVDLLRGLQQEMGLAYLLIAHDLSLVRHVADRVAVMYMGTIVETAAADRLYRHPHHPYTQALLSAAPVPDPARQRLRKRIALPGDVPDAKEPPSGCRFHTRCPIARMPGCDREAPRPWPVADAHTVACRLASDHPVPEAGPRGRVEQPLDACYTA